MTRITLEQLRDECRTAWMELMDTESRCGIWRLGPRHYRIVYASDGLRFEWTPADSWHTPGEDPPW